MKFYASPECPIISIIPSKEPQCGKHCPPICLIGIMVCKPVQVLDGSITAISDVAITTRKLILAVTRDFAASDLSGSCSIEESMLAMGKRKLTARS